MFNGRAQATGGVYLTKYHIEEMEVLFGLFPAGLIKDGNPEIVQQLFDADYRVQDPTERPTARELQNEPWICVDCIGVFVYLFVHCYFSGDGSWTYLLTMAYKSTEWMRFRILLYNPDAAIL